MQTVRGIILFIRNITQYFFDIRDANDIAYDTIQPITVNMS